MTTKKKKKEEKKEEYDYITVLNNMDLPKGLLEGFLYRINEKGLNIKSENDLNKELTKFRQGV